ncbi:MAG: LacI family DNA-binding transcriptional regulator [Planctomycetes bacterium]|nr:LacI family DNA-binding transcriptional regulator [Planctomycetota bacterium]
MAATLKDIAHKTGLSVPSVCLILNGHGHKFRPESVQAVQQAAKDLRYRPDMIMRRKGQASSRHDAIGVMVVSDGAGRTPGPAVHEALWGVNHYLLERDQLMVFVGLDGRHANGKTPRLLAERFIDGLIVVGTGTPVELTQMVDHFQIPCVWLNTDRRGRHDCVYADDEQAARDSTLMGMWAAQMMLDKIKAGGAPQPSRVYRGELVEGATT